MTGTSSALAARPNGIAAMQQPGSEVAIRTGQVNWDDKQRAALVAIGVSEKATKAELAVFFHQCQRLGLDPFSKQIYLIHRKVKEGDKWVDKPTTQIGIDGFRVTRDRIAREQGVRVEYEDTIWYAPDGQAYDVWLWDEPPAACKFVVTLDGRRFPSVLRFNEYCQKTREGQRTGRWRDGFAHQIEKCAEADALRRAFPNDLSGVILEDAAPLDDPDAPAVLPQDRPRVTAAGARDRRPQTVTAVATTVTPDAASGDTTPAAPAPEAAPDHGRPGSVSTDQIGAIWAKLGQDFGYKKDEKDQARTVCAYIVGHDLSTTTMLSGGEASRILDKLAEWRREATDAAANPREYLELMTAPAAQDGADQ